MGLYVSLFAQLMQVIDFHASPTYAGLTLPLFMSTTLYFLSRLLDIPKVEVRNVETVEACTHEVFHFLSSSLINQF